MMLFHSQTFKLGNCTIRLTEKMLSIKYYKSRNFCKNFIFANSIKRHICDAKNSQLGHDLRISVSHRVISRGFYAKFHENKTPTKISEFTVLCTCKLIRLNFGMSFIYYTGKCQNKHLPNTFTILPISRCCII